MDEVLRQVEPGLDAFVTEKYAEQIEAVLEKWTAGLCNATGDPSGQTADQLRGQLPETFVAVKNSLSPNLQASSLIPTERHPLRPLAGLEIYRNQFPSVVTLNRAGFIAEFRQ